MNKHTPGPWIAEQRETHSAVLSANGLCPVADCPQWASRDDRPKAAESFANALLISAAPEMLNDLIDAAAQLRIYEILHRSKGTEESNAKAKVNADLAAKFEATIAKALGEA